MTEKLTMPQPASGSRKAKRGGGKRLLFHFVLFTVVGVLLLGFGIYGQVLLRRVSDEKITEARTNSLIEVVTDRVKAEAEKFAESSKQRSKISSGLSSKTRSVRSEAVNMLNGGKSEAETAAYIFEVLSNAAVSKLTDEDDATVALRTKVSTGLEEKRAVLISECLAQVEAKISAMNLGDVRTGLSRDTKDYNVMYYSPLMLWVGGFSLAIGLFCGAVFFFAGEDFRRKVTDFVEPMDYLDLAYDEIEEKYENDFDQRFQEAENDTVVTALENEWAEFVLETMKSHLDDITYKDSVSTIVEITTDDDGNFGISDKDWLDIDDLILDLDSNT